MSNKYLEKIASRAKALKAATPWEQADSARRVMGKKVQESEARSRKHVAAMRKKIDQGK